MSGIRNKRPGPRSPTYPSFYRTACQEGPVGARVRRYRGSPTPGSEPVFQVWKGVDVVAGTAWLHKGG